MNLNELIAAEDLHLKRLHDLVENAIAEEQLLTSKLLEAENDTGLSTAQLFADKIASFGGSWKFILSFFIIILIWILLNSVFWNSEGFDPYPFILLNLILSCVAALQAPVIMMSQNRQEEKDRRRARSDYMVNLKAEIEIRNLHSKIDLLITEQMKSLFDIQRTQLDLLVKMESRLEKMSNS